MRLVVDVGNTHTVFGAVEGGVLRRRQRVTTAGRGVEAWEEALQEALGGLPVADAVLGAVVPAAVPPLVVAIERVCGLRARVYGEGGDFGMPVRVDPSRVGPDRVANCLAARGLVPAPYLVVDLGTATTLDAVDAAGAFVGGAIAPGMGTAADALFARAARLPAVPLVAPAHAIGRDTVPALQSGIVLGHAAMVDGLARRIKAELGRGAPVACLATGGLAGILAPLCDEVDRVEENLLLLGLAAWAPRA